MRKVLVVAAHVLCLAIALWAGRGAWADNAPQNPAQLKKKFASWDKNGDGRLTSKEFPLRQELFVKGDRDQDGEMTLKEALRLQAMEKAKSKSQHKLKKLRKRFADADTNKDGVIGRDEFPATEQLFERFDRDGDDRVTPPEALAYSIEEEIGKVCDKHDLDLSGTLSRAEFPAEAEEMFDLIDEDGDGQVTGEEAYRFLYEVRSQGLAEWAGESAPPAMAKAKTEEPAALKQKQQPQANNSAQANNPGKESGVLGLLVSGFQRYDDNQDGRITNEELLCSQDLFRSLDIDSDGGVGQDELQVRLRVAKALQARGKRLREQLQQSGLESRLAVWGQEIRSLFVAGRYEETSHQLDQLELLIAREGR